VPATVAAMLRVLALALVVLGTASAPAQTNGASTPDAGDVVHAFSTAREWVNGFSTPRPDAPEAAVPINGARAVAVTLRQGGRIVGLGVDTAGDDLMLRRAVGRALSEMTGDPAFAGLPEDLKGQVGARLALELEVAGGLEPVVAGTFVDAAEKIRPGLDGIAMRAGERWIFRFPSQMRAANTSRSPLGHLPTLVTALELDLDRLKTLRREHGLSIYKFETTHLVQPEPDPPPRVTFRGGTIVPRSSVDRDAVVSLAEGLVSHRRTREWRPGKDGVDDRASALGLRGTYQPTADRYAPMVAPPAEQALASYALSYFARTPGVDPRLAAEAGALAVRVMDALAERLDIEPDPLDRPEAAAFIVLAGYELITGPSAKPPVKTLVDRAVQQVAASYNPRHQAFHLWRGSEGEERSLSPEARAALAAAMARLLHAEPGLLEPDTVRLALDAVWESVPETEHVRLLPWLGWGELDYARATDRWAGFDHLTEVLRSMLEASQVAADNAEGQPDLLGGFALAGRGTTTVTSQGLRPAAWTARLLWFEDATPPARLADAVGRHLAFVRFLLQLRVGGDDLWAFRSPGRVAGGIRNALWDHDQALPAQALALLTASDVLRGLDRLSTRLDESSPNPGE